MTEQEYRSNPAISRSELFKISKSPLHFKWGRDNPPEPTQALVFGQAFHKFVLETEDFGKEFAISPSIDRRTKDGREAWAIFMEGSSGKGIIRPDEFDTILDMSTALLGNEMARVLIEKSRHEVPFFWTDEMTGEPCKCRPDIITEFGETAIIADLKTCVSADTQSFMRDMVKYGYDLQAYMYTEGVRANTGKDYQFIFIAIEKTPPYAINIMAADKYILMRGESLFREYMGIYHECVQTGEWWGLNGHFGTINNLTLPEYLKKDFE